MAGILFEDIFDVKDIDPEGKKFDRGEKLLAGSSLPPSPALVSSRAVNHAQRLASAGTSV